MLHLSAQAATVQVAVASNFAAPMKLIAQAFEKDTGIKAILVFGSTGQFYVQIRHGAPYDVLLSADEATPEKLKQEGLSVEGSNFTYAVGRLVLWSKTPGFVDQSGLILRSDRFKKIAIANPKLAPYGAAALQTLDKLGLREQVATRLIEGANISQTFQYVDSENASIGFIALSQVMENGKFREGSVWLVPQHFHLPIRQVGILLKRGETNRSASALLRYLQGPKAREVIQSFGYELP